MLHLQPSFDTVQRMVWEEMPFEECQDSGHLGYRTEYPCLLMPAIRHMGQEMSFEEFHYAYWK